MAIYRLNTYRPYGLAGIEPPKPEKGIFEKIFDFADNATKRVTGILNNVGQVRAKVETLKTKGQESQREIRENWEKNITGKPPRDTSEDWITGIPNGVVIGGGAGLLLLVLMMKKKG